MAEATADKRKPRSRAAKVLRVIAALASLLTISAILAFPACNMRWNSYAEQLREKGEPLTYEEIDKLRTDLPDDQNNYILLMPLFADLESVYNHAQRKEVVKKLPILGKSREEIDFFSGISPSLLEAIREFVDEHAATLQKLEVVSDHPVGRIPLNIGAEPLDVCDAEFASLRTAAKLLTMQNATMLAEGDTSGAIHSTLLIAGMAGAMNEHPSIVSLLMQASFESYVVDTIENTLRVTSIEAEQLHQLDEAVNQRLKQKTIKWSFWGERAYFVEMCEWSISGKFSPPDRRNIPFIPKAIIRHNQIKGTQLLTMLVDSTDDHDAMLVAAANLEDETAQLSSLECLASMLIPSLSRAAELHLRIIGQLQSTRTSLAAEQYRMDNGHLPESLDQLVPDYIDAIPADPFDGTPLKLVTTDKGIIIYSIGEDKTDDGGNVASTQDGKRPTDFGFRLLETEHRGLVILDTPTEVHTNDGK